MKLFLVGCVYDDFSEGGFDTMFATLNEKLARNKLREIRQNSITTVFGYKPQFAIQEIELEKDIIEKNILLEEL